MTTEAILSYLHLLAILTAVVFITSEAALCRMEWMNAAVVRRLRTVDRIYWIAVAAIALTGLLRWMLGSKGVGWYASNWLLWAKVVLFALMAALSVPASRAFAAWNQRLERDGVLPVEAEVTRARRMVMRAGHVLPLIPLPAVFLARGFGA
jgi:putative membrane protein